MPTGSQGNKSWPPTSGVLAGAFKNFQVTGKFLPRNKGFPVPMVFGPRSSELSKLVANAMLAQRVSSINSISRRWSPSGLGKGTPMVLWRCPTSMGIQKIQPQSNELAVQTCCVYTVSVWGRPIRLLCLRDSTHVWTDHVDFVGTPAHDYGPKPCLAWANKLEQRMTIVISQVQHV